MRFHRTLLMSNSKTDMGHITRFKLIDVGHKKTRASIFIDTEVYFNRDMLDTKG